MFKRNLAFIRIKCYNSSMKEGLPPNEGRTQERNAPKKAWIRRNLGKYARGSLLLGTIIANYGVQGATLEEKGVEQPYSPAKAGVAAVKSYIALPGQLLGLDSCPPAPPQEEINHYFTTDYSWPETANSMVELAASHNLTLPLSEGYNRGIIFGDIDRAHYLDEIIAIISSRTEPLLGVTVTADGFSEHPEAVPDIQELRYSAKDFVDNIAVTPKEVFEATNVQRITIRPLRQETYDDTTGLSANGNFSPPGDIQEAGAEISLDITMLADSSVFQHELLGHGMHFAACHNFPNQTVLRRTFEDTTITSFNPADFRYDDERKQLYDNTYNEEYTVSGYAEKNVLEDVAEITSQLATGELQLTPELAHTPLGQKVGVILRRMDEQVPGLSDYYLPIVKTHLPSPDTAASATH